MPSLFRVNIRELKGVGEKRAKLLQKLGIESIGALLEFYPRKYIDFSELTLIKDIRFGDYFNIKAHIIDFNRTFTSKSGLRISKLNVSDGTDSLNLIFFNREYEVMSLKTDKDYIFSGRVIFNGYEKEIHSPLIFNAEQKQRIEPIYSLTSGLAAKTMKKFVLNALNMLPPIKEDTIPEWIRKKYNLCGLDFAIRNIHFPESLESLEKARRRISFESLLIFNMSMCRIKQNHRNINNLRIKETFKEEFLKLPKFKLTGSQLSVIDECFDDMINNKYTMNRLIQGDVGCGKTIVVAALAFCVIKNNRQVVIMAPTEILAEQHFKTFTELFDNLNINIKILTSSTKTHEAEEILKDLRDGKIDIVIGTHAVISEKVEFYDLGLVVTDEQHKFGVNQRRSLLKKGDDVHNLLISATPIPRSLALILYGDYDMSIIKEMPKGRKPVKTFHIKSSERNRMFDFIKNRIALGEQVYIVCPSIDEDTQMDIKSLDEYKDMLKKSCLSEFNFSFLHGKLKGSEKKEIMKNFSRGNVDILVSTTVVEVGVDVPNATIMVIENAERFGFSQIHQLRGRVGRSDKQSFCIMVSDTENEVSLKRLSVLCNTNDGFKIAYEDLKLRGPGEFFGTRQHGILDESLSSLIHDTKILKEVTNATKDIFSVDPYLKLRENRFILRQIKGKLKKIL